jgi:hypothetical protein
VCRKRRSHCRERRGSEFGIFPKNLAQSSDPRTDCEHRFEVAASNLLVMGSDMDFPETRPSQNSAHAIWIRNANGPGASGS